MAESVHSCSTHTHARLEFFNVDECADLHIGWCQVAHPDTVPEVGGIGTV